MRYRYCLNLIGELRKEKEFRQQCCRNSTKVGERKRKSWREKEEEFRQRCYRKSSAQIPTRSCVKKQLRQCHCRNREKKEIFFLVIVAMALPKMGKKIEWNYGNVITENERKKKNSLGRWHYRNKREKKYLFVVMPFPK